MPSRRCPEEPSRPSGNRYRARSGGARRAPRSAEPRKYGAWPRPLLQMRCVTRPPPSHRRHGVRPSARRGAWPRLLTGTNEPGPPAGHLWEAAPTLTAGARLSVGLGRGAAGSAWKVPALARGHSTGDAGTARECPSTSPKMGVRCPKTTLGDAQDLPGILSAAHGLERAALIIPLSLCST